MDKVIQLKAELADVFIQLEKTDNVRESLLHRKAALINAILEEQKSKEGVQEDGTKK